MIYCFYRILVGAIFIVPKIIETLEMIKVLKPEIFEKGLST